MRTAGPALEIETAAIRRFGPLRVWLGNIYAMMDECERKCVDIHDVQEIICDMEQRDEDYLSCMFNEAMPDYFDCMRGCAQRE